MLILLLSNAVGWNSAAVTEMLGKGKVKKFIENLFSATFLTLQTHFCQRVSDWNQNYIQEIGYFNKLVALFISVEVFFLVLDLIS